MANQTQQTVQEQPELKVERTNYGWRVQLPKYSPTLLYEAHRFNKAPSGNVNLLYISFCQQLEDYNLRFGTYSKLGGVWVLIRGSALTFARPETLEAKAFDLLLEAK